MERDEDKGCSFRPENSRKCAAKLLRYDLTYFLSACLSDLCADDADQTVSHVPAYDVSFARNLAKGPGNPGRRMFGSRPRKHVLHIYKHKDIAFRSEEHTSELQSHSELVCRLLLEKKK